MSVGRFTVRILFALLLSIPCLTTTAYAEGGVGRGMVGSGSVEFGLAGRWDVDPDDDTVSYINLTLGYFMFDGHEIGAKALLGVNELGHQERKGIFYEWNLVNGTRFIPFAGVDAMHAAPVKGSEDGKDAKYTSNYGGVKLVAAKNAALSLRYQLDLSTGKPFGPPNDRTGRNREVNLMFHLYW